MSNKGNSTCALSNSP